MEVLTSYQELDVLGEGLAMDFLNKMHETDALSIDIDAFVEDYLKLPIRYVSFAEKDKNIMGFLANGKDGVAVYVNNVVQKVIFPKNTIVIAQCFLKPSENCRRRFTLAHEAAHKILKNHLSLDNEKYVCNGFGREKNDVSYDSGKVLPLIESFANRLGAAILMPEFLLERELTRYNNGDFIKCYEGGVFSPEEKIKLQSMSAELGVYYSALVSRFLEIRMFDVHPIEEYISKILKKRGCVV